MMQENVGFLVPSYAKYLNENIHSGLTAVALYVSASVQW